MAADLERLVVQLSADIKKYENALNRASGAASRQARAIESRFAKMNKNIQAGAASAASGFVRAFAVIGGVQGFKNLSDSATRVDNALKVAGLSGAELEKTYQSLFSAATRNAVPIETLVNLYSRLSLVQGELGVSQQQIVGFTENIGLALRAGGTSAQEAAGALTQLGQALGGGVVRAEEFSSLIEGAPTILQAAAAGIREAGGSVAKLRQIMLDGELSSKALFDGFQAGATILDQRVANSVLTIDDRLTNLQSALIDAAREFNNSTAAGETFGAAIDQVSAFVNSVNFDSLIGQIQGIVNAANTAIGAANGLAQAFARLSGYDGIGRDIVNMLPGEGAQKSFFGGGLTITSTAGITDRINQAFEGEIQRAGDLTADAVRKSVLGNGTAAPVTTTPKAGRVPEAPSPISVKDPKYAVPATPKKGGGGGGKGSGRKGGRGGSGGSADDYQREIEQIKERTAALQAETSAQASVNPLVDDYGAAQARAQVASDLLTAAQKSGTAAGKELVDVQQLLSGNFDGLSVTARQQAEAMLSLANGYANATVESQKLATSQDSLRRSAEEFAEVGKDVTKGFISDLMEGQTATEALANGLKKVADVLLDQVLDAIFQVKGAGGGGGLGGLFSSLLGGGGSSAFPSAPVGLYSDGGYTGPGGKHQPAGVVHKGEVVWSKRDVRNSGGVAAVEAMRRGARGYDGGGAVGLRAPTMPVIRNGGRGGNFNVRSQVDVSVSDQGELRAFVKKTSVETVDARTPRHVDAFSRNALPQRLAEINSNPRKRG